MQFELYLYTTAVIKFELYLYTTAVINLTKCFNSSVNYSIYLEKEKKITLKNDLAEKYIFHNMILKGCHSQIKINTVFLLIKIKGHSCYTCGAGTALPFQSNSVHQVFFF